MDKAKVGQTKKNNTKLKNATPILDISRRIVLRRMQACRHTYPQIDSRRYCTSLHERAVVVSETRTGRRLLSDEYSYMLTTLTNQVDSSETGTSMDISLTDAQRQVITGLNAVTDRG